MTVIHGRNVNDSSKFGSTSTAKSVLMTTLTPTRSKAATKAGKTKRVTRRQTNDLMMQSEDDDGASHSEGGEQAGDGLVSQDPPQPKVTRPAVSEEVPTAEDMVPTPAPETPTVLSEDRTAAPDTTRHTTDASPTPDEHRADEPTAAVPATEVAALASTLYQLTTVVAGLQARADEGGQPFNPRATSIDGRTDGAEVIVTQDAPAAPTSRTGTEG
ncbi:hypothetical protein PF005_g24573 [Phytophthora fragariae]|uniref:Uncharacterized protein n=3 Tax=Phytophthora fragariae TaxID=53985 RepID=A0A6A3RGR9_9STRA|nr:hypothetical protein PF003_g8971 [Phytophthora fragariae]KAE8924426.1 hypothetical protein PF009_g25349 [Phytophthora fragariae]KAE9095386.1 hypothetical protein PF006_g24030 [Phytophthora fragariae]KAE9177271.1 hypothetical protein PF005_g24573 [Phytophthora fragariae]KAE9187934.1 hypothetical protein PF002_g25456 [Phytophthora fragariae]